MKSIVAILSIFNSVPVEAGYFDSESGYRVSAYRQVINKELSVGQTINSHVELDRLVATGALLVDVAPLPEYLWINDLKAWQLAEQHTSIPGAIWLPNVGRGVLDLQLEHYLKRNLAKYATKEQHIVVFCFEDCWMSWNATQRIFRLGYENVFWYTKGVTGRSPDQLRPLEPEPFRY